MDNANKFWHNLYLQSQQVDLSNMQVEPMRRHHDLSLSAVVDTRLAKWLPSPAEGVKRLVLERDGGEKTLRATSIVAYAPNSQFAPHEHPLGEEFFVLDGIFSDEYRDYPKGSYVRNPPGSSHQPFSQKGCLIWVKLQQFVPFDKQHVVINVTQKNMDVSVANWSRKILFDDYERVEMVYVHQTLILPQHWLLKGAELLLLTGELNDGTQLCPQGTWLRIAAKASVELSVEANSQLLVKYGHLA